MSNKDSTLMATLRSAFVGFTKDDLLTHTAALAFYSALSMAPLLVLVLWALSLVHPAWQGQLSASLTAMMGDKAAGMITFVVHNEKSRPMLGNVAWLIGIFVTIFSASAVFAQLQTTLNRVWRVSAKPHETISTWFKARVRAVGLLIGMSFLLIVSFMASAFIRVLMPGDSAVWSIAEYGVSLIVFVVAFGAMYRVLPDAYIAWPDATSGALLTAVLFVGGKFAIDLYIRYASIGGSYGPAGGLVVMLTWVYYASFSVLLGAELTHGLSIARGAMLPSTIHHHTH